MPDDEFEDILGEAPAGDAFSSLMASATTRPAGPSAQRRSEQDVSAEAEPKARELGDVRQPVGRTEPALETFEQHDDQAESEKGMRAVEQDHVDVQCVLAAFDDPRSDRQRQQRTGRVNKTSGSLNTDPDDHDPASSLVPPDIRVLVGDGRAAAYPGRLSADDVLVVRDLVCAADDVSLYARIVGELRAARAAGATECAWASWKDGCHLISRAPDASPTYLAVLRRVKEYFGIVDDGSAYVRFNWYADGADWKPLHHDTAAFSQRRSGKQNITVAVSLGGEREAVFRSCQHGTRAYLPQPNGAAYSFGNGINVNWKHGINALAPDRQAGHMGRISIIVWGFSTCGDVGHDEDSELIPAPSAFQQPCLQFQRGHCTYGERCKFLHTVAPPVGAELGATGRGEA